MAYKFQCPRCGGDRGLLVKLQSTPFIMLVEDGPSVMFDLPVGQDKVVFDNNFTQHEVICGLCGMMIMRIKDTATLTGDMLLGEGYIVEDKP
jgi:predicted RNA-binding Zn-ribbon protein involved in translation (DUF1610 family)